MDIMALPCSRRISADLSNAPDCPNAIPVQFSKSEIQNFLSVSEKSFFFCFTDFNLPNWPFRESSHQVVANWGQGRRTRCDSSTFMWFHQKATTSWRQLVGKFFLFVAFPTCNFNEKLKLKQPKCRFMDQTVWYTPMPATPETFACEIELIF